MATELTTGMKLEKPDAGDNGYVWFPVLERNIDKINDHAHSGTDASKIRSTNILAEKVNLNDIALWTADGVGRFYKEITIPNNANYADVFVMVKNAAGDQMFLDVKAVSGNTKKCRIYSNDSTLSATAHILV